MRSLFFHDLWISELYYRFIDSVNINSPIMNNKILGIIIIIFGGIVLFSKLEAAIWVSAISIGIGTGIFFFWKDEKNDVDK